MGPTTADLPTTNDPQYNGPHHYEGPHYDYDKSPKTFVVYFKEIESACYKGTDGYSCGDTNGFTTELFADSAKTKQIGELYQTGVVAKSGGGTASARVIHHQSFRFTGANGFPEGTIQTQGDDTALNIPTFTYRAVIGGTGAYLGALGQVSCDANSVDPTPGATPYYTFTLVNWNGKAYGY